VSGKIDQEDWDALIEVLDRAISLLDGRKVQPVKESFLEFTTTAAMLGLEDVADAVTSMLDFLVKQVGPSWDEEAAATLSFTMASFREKMAAEEYSPAFSEGMKEILLFMDFFEKEEPEPQAKAEPKAAPIPEGKDAVPPRVEPPPSPPPEPLLDEIAEILDVETHDQEPAESLATVEETPEDIEALLDSLQPPPLDDAVERSVATPRREEPSAVDLRDAPAVATFSPEESDRGLALVTDAVEFYREMLKIDPTSTVFVHLAEELSAQGLWNETVEVCRRGLILHPRNLRGLVLLGLALRETGESHDARAALGEARREIEKNILLYRVLAEFAEEEGDLPRAERLRHVYDTFQGDDRTSLASPKRRPVKSVWVPPPAAKKAESTVEERLMELLSRLLAQVERQAPAAAPTRGIFTRGSRDKLKKALSSRIS